MVVFKKLVFLGGKTNNFLFDAHRLFNNILRYHTEGENKINSANVEIDREAGISSGE